MVGFFLCGVLPRGLKKMETCVKRRATIRYGGRARREARVPVVETVHEMLLLRNFLFFWTYLMILKIYLPFVVLPYSFFVCSFILIFGKRSDLRVEDKSPHQ